MQALRQLVQNVRRLVHPTALFACRRPHLAESLPEPKRTVSDGKLRRRRQAATLEIEQQITPRLRALAHAIGEADQLLLALRRRTDESQECIAWSSSRASRWMPSTQK